MTDAGAPRLAPALVAEALGAALLVAAVVGSGILAERLSAGNAALALLCNTVATGAALLALIVTFAPVSGAHFNPAVSLALAARGELPWRRAGPYALAQCGGGLLGVAAANLMFGLPAWFASRRERAGGGQLLGEFIATLGLLLVITGGARRRPGAMGFAVAAWIAGAYWFTSSTSFANPAVTLARAASDTFAGIRPADVPGFVLAQLLGAAAAVPIARFLFPRGEEEA